MLQPRTRLLPIGISEFDMELCGEVSAGRTIFGLLLRPRHRVICVESNYLGARTLFDPCFDRELSSLFLIRSVQYTAVSRFSQCKNSLLSQSSASRATYDPL